MVELLKGVILGAAILDLAPEGSNKSNLIDALASLKCGNFRWAKLGFEK